MISSANSIFFFKTWDVPGFRSAGHIVLLVVLHAQLTPEWADNL